MSDRGPVVAATWMCWNGDALLGVHPFNADVYFLPGGMPEDGETLAEAAAREVHEEVGVVVDSAWLVEVARVKTAAHGRPGLDVQLVCFEGPGVGQPTPDAVEVDRVRWLVPSEWHLFALAVQQALEVVAPGGVRRRAGVTRG